MLQYWRIGFVLKTLKNENVIRAAPYQFFFFEGIVFVQMSRKLACWNNNRCTFASDTIVLCLPAMQIAFRADRNLNTTTNQHSSRDIWIFVQSYKRSFRWLPVLCVDVHFRCLTTESLTSDTGVRMKRGDYEYFAVILQGTGGSGVCGHSRTGH